MRYQIQFFDYWHLGSGTSAGTALDALVVKDEAALPYLPGKTLKGLVREMVEILDVSKVPAVFGEEGSSQADSYFSNAQLDASTQAYLKEHPELVKHLFDKLTSTQIGENGVAVDKSLREIEVVVPLILEGTIESQEEGLIIQALSMIKQIGLNRNRGLGRCQIQEVKDDN